MYPLQEQFRSDALAQLNTRMLQAGRIAGNLLEISHDIGVLNVRTGRASAEALAGAVQKLFAANNPVEFFQLAATVMRPDPQVWTDYADQLRGIAGRMVAPVTENAAESAAEAAPPVDLQGVVPPAAMEVPVQEPPLPVEAAAPAEAQPVMPDSTASQPDVAPEVPKAVQEVAEVISNVAKSAPVISAAATPGPAAMAKTAVVPKATVKASRAQAAQKGAAPSSAASRSRKG